jgi:hypothetical protein
MNMAWGVLLFDGARQLRAGEEWAQEVYVWGPGVVNLTAAGTVPFYIGLYTQDVYNNTRRMNPGRYPFLPGTARPTHFARYQIPGAGHYVVVVRVTGWSQGGEVRFRAELGQ